MDGSREYYAFQEIESHRLHLSRSKESFSFIDYGAKAKKDKVRYVSDIAKQAVSGKRKCRWLFQTVLKYQPRNIIELGSSLGISTLYLSAANSKIPVFTLEGDPGSARIARHGFKKLGRKNIQLTEGPFDKTLKSVFDKNIPLGLVYIDGNHSEEATIEYFNMAMERADEDTILVFDDIYWSEGMSSAWDKIKLDPRVSLTIDLYQMGFVFCLSRFREKQDFKLIDSKFKFWQKYLP